MSRTSILLNTVIGEYRLLDLIGEGGMGEVYRAHHNKIGRLAAVKVLSAASASDDSFVERFFNEARIQASLQHPNIATLYDFREVNGQPCIIMEYVDGETLSEHIRSQRAWSVIETLGIFQAIVDAVAYVHGHGIVHRDIKSKNIKVGTRGEIKLLDFGIAKTTTMTNLTVTGAVIGTLEYLSPEQLRGERADARSDIWALGILLYEMLTRQMPFAANTFGELYDKINKAVYLPPSHFSADVPREVEAIIARCLQKNPMGRYQSALELRDEVARLVTKYGAMCAVEGHESQNTGSIRRSFWTRKNAAVIVGVAAALTVCALAAVLYLAYLFALPAVNNQPPAPAAFTTARSKDAAAAQPTLVQIDVAEGRADVYRDGERLGATPYDLKTNIGERVELTLRREGYSDYPVALEISANKKAYTFMMKK